MSTNDTNDIDTEQLIEETKQTALEVLLTLGQIDASKEPETPKEWVQYYLKTVWLSENEEMGYYHNPENLEAGDSSVWQDRENADMADPVVIWEFAGDVDMSMKAPRAEGVYSF